MFSWQVRQSLETVLSSWPRETTHGFLQHFTTRFSFIHSGLTASRQDFTPPYSRQMNVISEYSTIDSTILVGLTHNPIYKIESLFLRHLELCLPETTLEARCALERRPNWTRSVREMKCTLVVNV